jgi:hypothetical protein
MVIEPTCPVDARGAPTHHAGQGEFELTGIHDSDSVTEFAFAKHHVDIDSISLYLDDSGLTHTRTEITV